MGVELEPGAGVGVNRGWRVCEVSEGAIFFVCVDRWIVGCMV